LSDFLIYLDFLTFSSVGFSFCAGAALLRGFSALAVSLAPYEDLTFFETVLLAEAVDFLAVDFLVCSTFAFLAGLVLAFLVDFTFFSLSFFLSSVFFCTAADPLVFLLFYAFSCIFFLVLFFSGLAPLAFTSFFSDDFFALLLDDLEATFLDPSLEVFLAYRFFCAILIGLTAMIDLKAVFTLLPFASRLANFSLMLAVSLHR